jgi:peptidoglycan hydrolase-like protein with peptidoglycan-binding domain
MTQTMTRSQFTQRFADREIDLRSAQNAGVNAQHMQALRSADANNDGKVSGPQELDAAFTGLDDFDRNGDRNSVAMGTQARPTAMQSTVNTLERATTQAPRRGLASGGQETSGAGTLRQGARGAGVQEAQELLRQHGATIQADGAFGPRTRAAVVEFQRGRGITADGVIGPETMRHLRSEPRAGGVDQAPPANRNGREGVAQITRTTNAGARNQLVEGQVTVNGNTYNFRSGGFGRGSLPAGDYQITRHLDSRSDRSMSVGGVGYSFAMSDKYDPRVNGTRTLLRIHPDGGSAGTEGCLGIVGNADVQRRFREDMLAAIRANGGSYTLTVR